MTNSFTNKLKSLKKNGVVGIKQSFEDEGVLDRDLLTMNQLCKLTGLNIIVKTSQIFLKLLNVPQIN